ncbi:Phytocyanin domain-containing protein [Fusarium sp. LHS14.1]|nr:Phytocyanin domain-containing protein [Fusarium sp. LHS14.1]
MHSSTLLFSLIPAAYAAVHKVKVGDGGLTFSPADLKAAVGDTVEFHFYKGTHSVAQSSFDKPCEPLNSTSFFSGDFSVSDAVSDEVFTITVDASTPIWYYCAVQGHCQGGMVGVINAPSSGQRTLAAYKKAAADVDETVEPSSTGGGELGPAATASSGSSEGSSSTGSAASSTASSTESAAPNAGIESRGEIRWGLMSLGVAMAGFVGGLMI